MVADVVFRKWEHLVAPKPSRDEDLALPHLLVVGPTAPTAVDLLYEGGQLLKPQAPLFFQVEKLGEQGRGACSRLHYTECTPLQASQLTPSMVSVYSSRLTVIPVREVALSSQGGALPQAPSIPVLDAAFLFLR